MTHYNSRSKETTDRVDAPRPKLASLSSNTDAPEIYDAPVDATPKAASPEPITTRILKGVFYWGKA